MDNKIRQIDVLQRCIELGVTDIVQITMSPNERETYGYSILNGQLELTYVFRHDKTAKWDYEKPIGERWVEINLRGRHGA